jgi:hypothetical protein
MDTLFFLSALVAVAWTAIWAVMNDARPAVKVATHNARGRGKSQIPPGN